MAVPLFLFVIGYGSVSPAVYGCCRICLCSGIRTDLFTDILPSDGKDGQVFSRQEQKAGSRAAFLKAGRRPSCSPFPCFPGGKANFSSFSQNNADGTDKNMVRCQLRHRKGAGRRKDRGLQQKVSSGRGCLRKQIIIEGEAPTDKTSRKDEKTGKKYGKGMKGKC